MVFSLGRIGKPIYLGSVISLSEHFVLFQWRDKSLNNIYHYECQIVCPD